MGDPFFKPDSSPFENLADGGGDGRPAVFLIKQLFAAGRCEFVYTGAPVVLGGGPLGADPTALFQAMEGRVEGSLLDAEEAGDGFDLRGDSVAMQRTAPVENLEDQERKGALECVLFRHSKISQ